MGDPVYFTGMNGTRWRYQVAERTVLAATAVEEMTSGAYDLTLFTCTYGGQSPADHPVRAGRGRGIRQGSPRHKGALGGKTEQKKDRTP